MNHPGQSPTHPLSIALVGGVISVVGTVVALVAREEHDIPLASFGIGVAAGVTAGIVLWVAVVMLNRWQLRMHDRDQQLRRAREQLMHAQSQIFDAQKSLRWAIGPDGDWGVIGRTINDVESTLRPLAVDGPTYAGADHDIFLFGIEWESYLSALYPLARDGDIKGARRLWRGWRFKLRNILRRRWRALVNTARCVRRTVTLSQRPRLTR